MHENKIVLLIIELLKMQCGYYIIAQTTIKTISMDSSTEPIVSLIEQKYASEFAILRQLASIPNLIPALTKLGESYKEPRKTISRPSTVKKSTSGTLQGKEVPKKEMLGKSRNVGPKPQATCPEPKKEAKKDVKKRPTNYKSSKDVINRRNSTTNDTKKFIKEVKKQTAKEVKKVRPQSSREINKISGKNVNKSTTKKEEEAKSEVEKEAPTFLEPPKEIPEESAESESPPKSISLPIPTPPQAKEESKAELSVPQMESFKAKAPILGLPTTENAVENKIILQKLLRSSLMTVHSYLPKEYRRQLPVLNREFLQHFLSKLIEQARRQLVENEKAINNIPIEIRDNVHEEAEEVFKLSETAINSLGKLKECNEIEFLDKADEKERWLLSFVLLTCGHKEITWENSKETLVEKIITGGLGKFIEGRLQSFAPTDEEVYNMRRYIGKNTEWIEEEWYETNSLGKLILPAVKETATFAGVINPTPKQAYLQSQYLFEVLSETKDRIIEFAKSMKLTV